MQYRPLEGGGEKGLKKYGNLVYEIEWMTA
jgi:hypothetical protein